MQQTAERTILAFLDSEDSPTISSPIHSTEVAGQYGFQAALVGSVTVWGGLLRRCQRSSANAGSPMAGPMCVSGVPSSRRPDDRARAPRRWRKRS
ncbi:MAG: hypothetical protein IPH65_17600 [Dehalococcoidia bacterium]|uniref:hypothetical protein n=1 Tax=Candidatus Amarobacter glycogenicus TaxID=3140699 RepID=UPI003135F2CB|nr:hypothetical protein [Dehalococcoidia bacterium]